MPQTGIACSSSLGIRLDGTQRSYAPGDAITGHVYRRSHTVNTNASIFISLSGRSKTKIADDMDCSDTKRGRFNLISAKTQLKIFQGPIHIAVGNEHVWPFSITLPKYVNAQCLRNNKQRESFVPLRKANHILPSTYVYSPEGDTRAFIEYYLTATLKLGGKNKSVEATLPITVTRRSPNPPIADFGLNRARSHHKIMAYRLVPGMEEAKLSFYQQLKQNLKTSSVPLLAFDLVVGFPAVIQLDNPDRLPVLLHIIPNRAATSRALRNVPQQVELSFISVRVVRTIDLLCGGIFSSHSKEHTTEFDLDVMDTLSKVKGGIYIPCVAGSRPIDLRGIIDLRLGCYGRQYSSSPSFTTYNIRQSHSLKWELRGAIAGEYFKVKGVSPITLLAPNGEREPGRVGRDAEVPLANPGAENEGFIGPSQPIQNK